MEQPPAVDDLNSSDAQTHVLEAVTGSPSVQERQLVAEATHVAQGEVHTVHPPAAAERKKPVEQKHESVLVTGKPSLHDRHFVAEVTHVVQGATQGKQVVPDK